MMYFCERFIIILLSVILSGTYSAVGRQDSWHLCTAGCVCVHFDIGSMGDYRLCQHINNQDQLGGRYKRC